MEQGSLLSTHPLPMVPWSTRGGAPIKYTSSGDVEIESRPREVRGSLKSCDGYINSSESVQKGSCFFGVLASRV